MPFFPTTVEIWCSEGSAPVLHTNATVSTLDWSVGDVSSSKGKPLKANRWGFEVGPVGTQHQGSLVLLPPNPSNPKDDKDVLLDKLINCGDTISIAVVFASGDSETLSVKLHR